MKQVTPEEVYYRWLAALRSGQYTQGQDCLRYCAYDHDNYNWEADHPKILEVHGHCCLGVLEDLAVQDGGKPWNSRGGPQDNDAKPRQCILDFMGLDEDMVSHLITMNDEDDATFEEIADTIEFTIMPSLGYYPK